MTWSITFFRAVVSIKGNRRRLHATYLATSMYVIYPVSIKQGLRIADCGLGIKYGLGIKRGLRTADCGLGIKYGLRTTLVKTVLIVLGKEK